MKYRTDPRSGNKLSVLGYGCMRFPRNTFGIDLKKTESLIKYAVSRGINYFDTAYMYPGSEEALGTVLSDNSLREKVYIATKIPTAITKKAGDPERFLNESLSRLKTDYIDYLLMHLLTSYADFEKLVSLDILNLIPKWKNEGKARQVGFSFHGTREEFLKILEAYDWDFCMIQFNYSDENYQAGITGLKAAAAKNIPVMIMEPLLGGKLAVGLPDRAVGVLKRADPNRSAAAWGIGWVLNHPEVTTVLSGMNSPMQIKDNLLTADSTAAGSFTAADLKAIETARQILKETDKIPCTGCGYCMPCPRNVNIPGCFSAYNSSFTEGFMPGLKNYFMNTAVMSKTSHLASQCIHCHKCEKICPQNIKISDMLTLVKKRFEKLPVRAAIKIFKN
ncbi:MAG: aldo/keto reductase [Ruminococcus sp.]|jgi:predicted aldo/keto reductase-like oxidoreductase|nr:aldo/keto reductase [Ruminococcus sp.]